MKLDIEDSKKIEIEMDEAELMKEWIEWMRAQRLEHEDVGDRD